MTDFRGAQKIKQVFDYQAYIEEHCSYLFAGGDEWRICCPNCGDDDHKLYINNSKKKFHCFKCAFSSGSHDVFDLVSLIEGISRPQAVVRLCREYVDVAPDWDVLEDALQQPAEPPNSLQSVKALPSLPDGAFLLDNPEDEEQAPYWAYLFGRGLRAEEVRSIKAHYVPHSTPIQDASGKYKGNIGRRVLLPLYGGDHALVSWQARKVFDDDSGVKYFNCPDTAPYKTLWPFIPPRGTSVVLVEGVFDSLGLRRAGLPAYATFSKKISKEQIMLLKQWGVCSVSLFWDKRDAKREMSKAIEDLKMHFVSVFVPDLSRWPLEKDAGDLLLWEDGVSMAANMFAPENLIDVESMSFLKWKLL